jgi:hypothetical protein
MNPTAYRSGRANLLSIRVPRVSICKSVGVKEIAVTASDHSGKATQDSQTWGGRLGRIGVDWWATIVAGILVLLAVAGLLPKVPW